MLDALNIRQHAAMFFAWLSIKCMPDKDLDAFIYVLRKGLSK